MADMRLIVAGAGGRMGRTLIKAIAETKGLALAGAVEAQGSPLIGAGRRRAGGARRTASRSRPTPGAARQRRRHHRLHHSEGDHGLCRLTAGKAHIVGTTGHSAENEAKIRRPPRSAVIVKSGNMSLGVNLLAALTKRVAKTLDDSFDIEIFEMHHNKKIDAPSGTALMFGRAAAEAAASISRRIRHAAATARPARARRAILALRVCAAAPWSASTA